MSERPRVLYITHRVPYPPDKGDRIRNWHVLKQLAAHTNVTLASLADEPVPDSTRTKLAQVCQHVEIEPITWSGKVVYSAMSALAGNSLSEGAFKNPRLSATVDRLHESRPFDALIASASSLAPYVRRFALRNIPAFVDVVDVDSQKWYEFASAVGPLKRWLYGFEGSRVLKIERDIATWAKAITLVSDAETKLFNESVGREVAMTATNGVDLEYFQPSATIETHSIAFVGALDYLPNIEGAVWFVREIWPAIHTKHPQARFRIIGRKPASAVKALATIAGVEIIASPADVRPHVADAAIVVVPMQRSRGLQNKVLEALAMGKAVIASPPALVALKAVPEQDLLKAISPQQWIVSITKLLNDEPRRRELGANGRRFVEEHHDWATCLKPLIDRLLVVCSPEIPA